MRILALLAALVLQGNVNLTPASRLVLEYPPEITTVVQAQGYTGILKIDGMDTPIRPQSGCAINVATAPQVTCQMVLTGSDIGILNTTGRHVLTMRLVYTDSNNNAIQGAESVPLIWNHGPGAPGNLRIQP